MDDKKSLEVLIIEDSMNDAELLQSQLRNAGIAVAYSGRRLGLPVTVVVPETTTKRAIEAIEQEDAEVIIKGATWQEALHYSLDLTGSGSIHIHPFDNSSDPNCDSDAW